MLVRRLFLRMSGRKSPSVRLMSHSRRRARVSVRDWLVLSPGTLIVSLFAGILGVAYFMYGKRQQNLTFLFAGIGLCVYPYLVRGLLLEILLGVLLAAGPFFLRN